VGPGLSAAGVSVVVPDLHEAPGWERAPQRLWTLTRSTSCARLAWLILSPEEQWQNPHE